VKKLIKASFIIAVIILSTTALSCSKSSEYAEPSDPAFQDEWLSDFDAAKSKAKTEQKDLFISFTGSDWSPWCKKLENEVFGTELFQQEVTKYFVVLVLDFPQDQSLLSQKAYRQNVKLYKKYGVPGLPTVILADAEGREYARTGYREGGPEKYLEHLQDLRKLKP